jgi:hypothetical protein
MLNFTFELFVEISSLINEKTLNGNKFIEMSFIEMSFIEMSFIEMSFIQNTNEKSFISIYFIENTFFDKLKS